MIIHGKICLIFSFWLDICASRNSKLGELPLGFICLVDRASWIVWIITNTMHCLSSVYWTITPLHVAGASAAHHHEVACMYVATGTGYNVQLTVSGPGWNCSQACWQSTQKYRIFPSITRVLSIQKCSVNGKKWWCALYIRCALCN
jgi:hypothetical protein